MSSSRSSDTCYTFCKCSFPHVQTNPDALSAWVSLPLGFVTSPLSLLSAVLLFIPLPYLCSNRRTPCCRFTILGPLDPQKSKWLSLTAFITSPFLFHFECLYVRSSLFLSNCSRCGDQQKRSLPPTRLSQVRAALHNNASIHINEGVWAHGKRDKVRQN